MGHPVPRDIGKTGRGGWLQITYCYRECSSDDLIFEHSLSSNVILYGLVSKPQCERSQHEPELGTAQPQLVATTIVECRLCLALPMVSVTEEQKVTEQLWRAATNTRIRINCFIHCHHSPPGKVDRAWYESFTVITFMQGRREALYNRG